MQLIRKICYILVLPIVILCCQATSGIVNTVEVTTTIRFGIIADIQYCDCDTRGNRYYRHSLKKLDECVDNLNKEKVQFTVNLGDLVDRDTPHNLDSVLFRLKKLCTTVYNTTGNHDYGGIQNNNQLFRLLNMPNEYYSFKRGEWRFIILNTNEIASYSNIVGTWKENELEEIKNKILKVSGQNAVEYNGGISSRQLQWLQKLLVNSENSSEKVLIFSHHPLDCVNGLTALNSKEIISLVSKFNCVKVLIAGHHHEGFICERNPLPLIVIEGMVETAYQNSYGIIELFPDKLILNGYGRMTSKIIRFESNNFVCFY